jgi:hypothetical protein
MTDHESIHEPAQQNSISSSTAGEDVSPMVDAGAAVKHGAVPGHEDVPAREVQAAAAPRITHSPSGAMSARMDEAPTARDLKANEAAAAARSTGKRSDLLRYLRLRRK